MFNKSKIIRNLAIPTVSGVAICMLSGCAITLAPQTDYSYVKETIPTEHQIEVASEMGYARDAISNRPLKVDEYEEIIPATDMIDRMEERYGIDFRPGKIDHWTEYGNFVYAFTVTANEGPAAGRSFNVYATEQKDGHFALEDDYYIVARSDDYQTIMNDIVDKAMSDLNAQCDYRIYFTTDTSSGTTSDTRIPHTTSLDAQIPDEVFCRLSSTLYLYGNLSEQECQALHNAVMHSLRDTLEASVHLETLCYYDEEEHIRREYPDWHFIDEEEVDTPRSWKAKKEAEAAQE